MAEKIRQYVAIDAKSFYASVECVERTYHYHPLHPQICLCFRTDNRVHKRSQPKPMLPHSIIIAIISIKKNIIGS